MKNFYCENCFKEDLKNYVINSIGSVFCSNKCLNEFKEFEK